MPSVFFSQELLTSSLSLIPTVLSKSLASPFPRWKIEMFFNSLTRVLIIVCPKAWSSSSTHRSTQESASPARKRILTAESSMGYAFVSFVEPNDAREFMTFMNLSYRVRKCPEKKFQKISGNLRKSERVNPRWVWLVYTSGEFRSNFGGAHVARGVSALQMIRVQSRQPEKFAVGH